MAMRISFVLPYWRPYTGGVETAAFEVARVLARSHQVQIHTSYHGPSSEKLPLGWRYDDGCRCSVRRYWSADSVVGFVPKLSGADVVHCHGFHRGLTAATLLASRRVPAILQPYGNVSQVPGEPPGWSRSVRLGIDKYASRMLLSRFARVLCLKEEERVAMVQTGTPPSRCVLVRAPIAAESLEVGDVGAERDGLLFLVVGRLTPGKYVEHALRALTTERRARLVVLGPTTDERYTRALQATAREMDLTARVEFRGAVNHIELREWYERATGLILCSRSEGQGLVLSEAVLHGVVPIATNEAVGELALEMSGVVLYPWGNVGDLSAAIGRVVDSRGPYAASIPRAQDWVRSHLAPEVIAAQLSVLYEEVVAEARASRGGSSRGPGAR